MKFFAFALLLSLASSLPASEDIVGRKYWIVSAPADDYLLNGEQRYSLFRARRELGQDTGSFRVLAVDDAKYQVERADGVRSTIAKFVLEQGIEDKALVPYDPAERKKQDRARAAAANKTAEEKRAASIKAKRWPADVEQAVIKRRVNLGMTPEQVTLAIGKPQRVNRSVGSWGVNEQWVYGGPRYLYFENGALKSWQD